MSIIHDISLKNEYKGRFYHNWNHIEMMLDNMNKIPLTDLERELLSYAIVFHDIVYDSKKTNNEENSVFFMEDYLLYKDINMKDASFINQVKDLILVTKNHAFSNNKLHNIMIELDLSIFNCSIIELIEYEDNIFKEYQFVDINTYREERIKFLTKLAEKFSESSYFNKDAKQNVMLLIDYIRNKKYKIGIYPGSFNPFHVGHLNVLQKAENILDKVIVARGYNPEKSQVDRCPMPSSLKNEIISYDGLVSSLFKEIKNVEYFLVRGMRNEHDVVAEENLIKWVHEFNSKIETLYLFCDPQFEHISSSAIKGVSLFDKDAVEKFIVR